MVAPVSDPTGILLQTVSIMNIGILGEEDHFEGDYFDELRSPEIIMSGDLFADDYDLDMGDAPSSFPSSGLSAGRLFGDEHLHLGGLRERSTPATDGVETRVRRPH